MTYMNPKATPDTLDNYADYAPYYDLYAAGKDEDVPIYMELAREADGPTLELGCGTGRVTIPLAANGCKILGLDSSASMLRTAKKKLAAEPESVRELARLVEGDMRNFELPHKFGLVIAPWFAFNYLLTNLDREGCLNSVRNHLLPGGVIALDLFVPLTITQEPVPEFKKRAEAHLDDGTSIVFVDRRTYNPGTRIELREHRHITISPDGEESERRFSTQRCFCDAREMAAKLDEFGFEVRQCWGGYDKSHLLDAERNFLVIAQLPARR